MVRYLEELVGATLFRGTKTILAVVGDTHYLDGVHRSELQGTALCRGVDPLRRPFVTFRVTVRHNPSQRICEKDVVYTVFQRYTDDDSIFVLCPSHATPNTRAFAEVVRATCLVTPAARAALYRFFRDRTLVSSEYTCVLVGGLP